LVGAVEGREHDGVLAYLSLVLPAVPEAVPRARAGIARLCEQLGLERSLAEDVALAVTEACTNCVLHSHVAHALNPTFVLHARVEDGALLVVVRDFGTGLAHGPPTAVPPDSVGLGLGLRLIDRLADTARVSTPPGGGVRVAMRFAPRAGRRALVRPAA
jgi:anti-sigma regulatory factor (Ser/Thr protein kinase)